MARCTGTDATTIRERKLMVAPLSRTRGRGKGQACAPAFAWAQCAACALRRSPCLGLRHSLCALKRGIFFFRLFTPSSVRGG